MKKLLLASLLVGCVVQADTGNAELLKIALEKQNTENILSVVKDSAQKLIAAQLAGSDQSTINDLSGKFKEILEKDNERCLVGKDDYDYSDANAIVGAMILILGTAVLANTVTRIDTMNKNWNNKNFYESWKDKAKDLCTCVVTGTVGSALVGFFVYSVVDMFTSGIRSDKSRQIILDQMLEINSRC